MSCNRKLGNGFLVEVDVLPVMVKRRNRFVTVFLLPFAFMVFTVGWVFYNVGAKQKQPKFLPVGNKQSAKNLSLKYQKITGEKVE